MNERQIYIDMLIAQGRTPQQAQELADFKFGSAGTSMNSGQPAQNPMDALFPLNESYRFGNPDQSQATNANPFPNAQQLPSGYTQSAYTRLGTTYAGGSDANSMDQMTGLPIPAETEVAPTDPLSQISQYAELFNPYGTDVETELYSLGQQVGANPTTTEGKVAQGLGIAGAAGAALFGSARGFLSGLSNSNATQRYWEWMQKQKQQQNYTPASQTLNTSSDNRGGVTTFKNGGRFIKLNF